MGIIAPRGDSKAAWNRRMEGDPEVDWNRRMVWKSMHLGGSQGSLEQKNGMAINASKEID